MRDTHANSTALAINITKRIGCRQVLPSRFCHPRRRRQIGTEMRLNSRGYIGLQPQTGHRILARYRRGRFSSALSHAPRDLKLGFVAGNFIDGPVVREIKPGGTHGYSPTHPEMRAAFVITGYGINQGVNLGVIDIRSIAAHTRRALGGPGCRPRTFHHCPFRRRIEELLAERRSPTKNSLPRKDRLEECL